MSQRAEVLSQSLRPLLTDSGAELWPWTGGYFMWLAFPRMEAAQNVAKALMSCSPPILVGMSDGAYGLRLSLATATCDQLRQAARSIAAAVGMGSMAREVG